MLRVELRSVKCKVNIHCIISLVPSGLFVWWGAYNWQCSGVTSGFAFLWHCSEDHKEYQRWNIVQPCSRPIHYTITSCLSCGYFWIINISHTQIYIFLTSLKIFLGIPRVSCLLSKKNSSSDFKTYGYVTHIYFIFIKNRYLFLWGWNSFALTISYFVLLLIVFQNPISTTHKLVFLIIIE